jgi:GH24 family phage-related lysozyme (muramidase)
MNSNKFLGILFCLAIVYQLFCTSFIAAENSTDIVKIDSVFNTFEQTANIEHNKRPKEYRLSKVGKDFIKSKETCVLKAYNDPDPKRRSVGWGHQIRPGENLESITQKKADELFEKDIEWVNDAINRLINRHDKRFAYSQGFIDGLGSLIYNCGEYGVTLTEFWNRWSKCRYDKSSPSFINQNDLNFTIAAVKTSRISAKGHIERRYDEHKLMLN